jgi:diguanylate cyclase (GGDEF)-like protein
MEHFSPPASRNPLFRNPLIAAVVTAALIFVTSLLGLWSDVLAPHLGIWPANSILLGILAIHPRANTPVTWGLALVAYVTPWLVMGNDLSTAGWHTVINLTTVALGLALVRSFRARISPITNPSGLVTLFAIMIVTATMTGFIGGLVPSPAFDIDWLGRFLQRTSTEFANFAIFLPLVIGGVMIEGPPRLRTPRDRGKLLRHGAALAALLVSCGLMVVIGGPGAFVFYLPALIWCATRIRSRFAFVLSGATAIWTLATVPGGVVLLGDGHNHIASSIDMASFRFGVGFVTLGAIAVVALNAFWRREHHERTLRSNFDSLTGLLTRREFYDSAEFALKNLKDGATSIAIAIDIDRFRSINDRHGLPAGDHVLQTVADLLTANIRRGDIVGRLGGEEFAIVLPGAGLEEGNRVAERMREAIAAEPFRDGDTTFSASVSIGLVEFRSPADVSRMLSLADEALYEAKGAGRNRVVAHTSDALEGSAA